MSQMIPQATVDVLRQYADISVQLYGIDCELYTTNNIASIDLNSPYTKPSDYTFNVIKTRVYIEWAADMHRLRKLGLFTEENLPIIAWLKWIPDSPVNGSYIRVPMQFVPKPKYNTDEFELIENLVKAAHDAVVVSAFRIAPRRVPNRPQPTQLP